MPSVSTPRPVVLAAAIVPAAALLLASPVGAATKYWDLNGTTPGAGATPTAAWNTNSLYWNLDATGVAAPTTFATNDAIVFSAGSDAVNAYTVTLNAGYTATGLTVEDGTVNLAGSALTLGGSPILVNNGATLATPTAANVATTAGSVYTLDGGTLSVTSASSSFVDVDSTITLGAGGGTIDYSVGSTLSIINPTTVISGAGGLTKTGSSVIAIASTNTYAGPTTISNGELRLRGGTNNNLPVTTALTVGANGILNFNQNVNQTVASLSGGGLVGVSSGTLTVSGATSTIFDGSIRDVANAGLSGATLAGGKLIKSGTSTLTLTGNSTYTGTTTVSNGGLVLADTTGPALGGTSSVTVGVGAVLTLGANDQIRDAAPVTLTGGRFAAAGFSEGTATTAGVGALSLGTGVAVIDFGTALGVDVLSFADSAAATWTGTLKVYNYSGTPNVGNGADRLYVGTGPTLTATQLGKIQFYADAGSLLLGGATQLPSGEVIVSVAPEPTTLAAFAGVGLVALRRRRRA